MIKTVVVTQKDIDTAIKEIRERRQKMGVSSHSDICPLARALSRATGKKISVGFDTYGPTNYERANLPLELFEFRELFDHSEYFGNLKHIKPKRFKVDIPDQFIAKK